MRTVLAAAALLGAVCFVHAQVGPSDADLLKSFTFRTIGPAVTGGRVVDIEVHPSQLSTVYVAGANGGLWKSINNTTTWTPIFDGNATISIGDFAIAPSDPETLWVGTGEHNNQRSSHYGDGVYKSTDGGKTWANMGLRDTWHIGRIAIDAKDPNTVYVAAQGPLYRSGGERGVYKTSDGGNTWALVLKGDNDTTGFIDVVASPKDSKVLYAASMDRLRRAWTIREAGPGSALYKSTDAGKTWQKMTNGLPTGSLGRIGLAISPARPNTVYATIITADPRGTGVWRTDDAGKTWKRPGTSNVPGGSYYGKIIVDPNETETVYVLGTNNSRTTDGAKTFKGGIDRGVHVDHHALWIDPSNSKHQILGNDGGLYTTYDGTDNWEFINNLPIPQFYAISVDMSVPYNVMGGLQDNGAWRGPSRSRVGSGIANGEWVSISGGDGFYSIADPEDPDTIYTSSQFGSITRFDAKTRTSRSIRPRETGQRANWMSPFFLSPHNAKTLYWAGNKLYRSTDKGTTWSTISPDLTTNNPEKVRGNVPHCTITTIDESPVKIGVLWVGTDDGNVWVSQDGGGTWTQVNEAMPGAPKEWWISRVSASPHDAGTAFVSITGFREDDATPYVYKTTDFGKTWVSIAGNLPHEQVSVVRQDWVNPDFLVVGTETSCHVSLDGGVTWNRFASGMPTSACQDLLIHRRDGELVVGTHGRGVYIANVTPLQQLTKEVRAKDAHLFTPPTGLAYSFFSNMFDAFAGAKRYTGANPLYGVPVTYYLKQAVPELKLEILDIAGNVVADLSGGKDAGLNTVLWNMRPSGGGGRRGGAPVAGQYLVRLTVGTVVEKAVVEVRVW